MTGRKETELPTDNARGAANSAEKVAMATRRADTARKSRTTSAFERRSSVDNRQMVDAMKAQAMGRSQTSRPGTHNEYVTVRLRHLFRPSGRVYREAIESRRPLFPGRVEV